MLLGQLRTALINCNRKYAINFGSSAFSALSNRTQSAIGSNSSNGPIKVNLSQLTIESSDRKTKDQDLKQIRRPIRDLKMRNIVRDAVPYVYMMSRLVAENKLQLSELLANSDFNSIIKRIESSANKLKFSDLAQLIKSLTIMNWPQDELICRTLQNELLSRVDRRPLDELLDVLSILSRNVSTNLQEIVVSTIASRIIEHMDELTTLDEMIDLYAMSDYKWFPETLLPKLEHTLTAKLQSSPLHRVNSTQLTQMLVMLQRKSRRATNLIKVIADRLLQQLTDSNYKPNYDPIYVANALIALNQLNYYDVALTSALCDYLTNRCEAFEQFKPALVKSLIIALGQMRIRHEHLLNLLIKEFNTQPDKYSWSEQYSLLLALAKLNHSPPELESLIAEKFVPTIKQHDVNCNETWLNYVWCLAFFKQLTNSHVDSILNMKPLFNSESNEHVIEKSKIMQIISVAKLEQHLDSTENISEVSSLFSSPLVLPAKDKEMSAFLDLVMQILGTFIPGEDKYLKKDIKNTLIGLEIDAEFIVNNSLRPLELDTISPPPLGTKYVHLLTVNFKDKIINCEHEYVGHWSLAARLLRSQPGHSVAFVYRNDLLNRPRAQKVTALKDIIKLQLNL